MSEFLITVGLGIIASFYGSIAAGAGFLSIPGLIFLGLSPDIAIATNKLADLGRFSASSYKFIKSGKVVWRYIFTLSQLAIWGGMSVQSYF